MQAASAMVHPAGCDGTGPDSPTRIEMEGRRQAMPAIATVQREPVRRGLRLH